MRFVTYHGTATSMIEGGATIRISKSKSGITKDEKLVVVYKESDGTYHKPIVLTRDEAVVVARRYKTETLADPDKGINLAAAGYILDRVQRQGWLEHVWDDSQSSNVRAMGGGTKTRSGSNRESTSPTTPRDENDQNIEEDEGFPSELDESALSTSISGPTRKYFPFLHPNQPAKIDQALIDDLAFVLSGVDPAKRVDPNTADTGVTLADLHRAPASRISPTKSLMEDHWYILAQLHALEPQEFRDLWSNATQRGGQEATDLIKVSRRLHKFKLDDFGKSLAHPDNETLQIEFFEHSMSLLQRQYRSARRKIEDLLQQDPGSKANPKSRSSTAKTKGGWFGFGGKNKSKKKTGGSAEEIVVPVSDEVREIVQRYLEVGVKLGRILRGNVVQRRKASSAK